MENIKLTEEQIAEALYMLLTGDIKPSTLKAAIDRLEKEIKSSQDPEIIKQVHHLIGHRIPFLYDGRWIQTSIITE